MNAIRWVAYVAVAWFLLSILVGVFVGKFIAARSITQATEEHEPCPIINLPSRADGDEPFWPEPSRSLRR